MSLINLFTYDNIGLDYTKQHIYFCFSLLWECLWSKSSIRLNNTKLHYGFDMKNNQQYFKMIW